MSKLYERIIALCEKQGISGYRLCKETGVQPSILTDLKMGRQKSLSAQNADKIATYFNVTVSYLLGTDETEKAPAETGKRSITNDELMFALWGDNADGITDADLEDVRRYAAFVKERKKATK